MLGDLNHWAKFLKDEKAGDTLYDVIGEPMAFRLNVLPNIDPVESRSFVQNIFVADIDSAEDVQQVHRIARKQAIQNDIALWNCQQWVFDVLTSLHEEFIIEDYEYHDAVGTLEFHL